MTRLSPVEKTTRYATIVDSLNSAFEFVMEHLDELGETPVVSINPLTMYGDDSTQEGFEVTVSSMKESC